MTTEPSDGASVRALGLELAAELMSHLPGYRARGWVPWGGWTMLWLLLLPSDDARPTVALGLDGGIRLLVDGTPRDLVPAGAGATPVETGVPLVLAALGHDCEAQRCPQPESDELVSLRLVSELERHLAMLGLKAHEVPVQFVESPEFESGAWSFGTTTGRHFAVHGLFVSELASGRWTQCLDLDPRRADIASHPSTVAFEVICELGLAPQPDAGRPGPGSPASLIRWGTT